MERLSTVQSVSIKFTLMQSKWISESTGLFFFLFVVLPQDLLSEARQRLGEIAKDPARYSTLLEGLVLQVITPNALTERHS